MIPIIKYNRFSNYFHNKAKGIAAPLNGDIEITKRCNLKCVHCYLVPESREASFNNELDCKEWRRIIDQVGKVECLWLTFTGGDPFLKKDFLDIYAYARKKGFLVSIFTNGTTVTPRIVKFLKKIRPFKIEISLYGATKKTYESITGTAGSFEACIRGISLLQENNIMFRVKTPLISLNYHELEKMDKFVSKLTGKKITYGGSMFPRLDGSMIPCNYRLSPKQAFQARLRLLRSVNGDSAYFKNVLTKITKPKQKKFVYDCMCTSSSFFIDSSGKIYICQIDRENGFDLERNSLEEICCDLIPRITKTEYKTDSECRSCRYQSICGKCPAAARLETGEKELPLEYYCKLAKLDADFAIRYFDNKEEVAEA